MRLRATVLLACVVAVPPAARAQVDGHVSLMADVLPNAEGRTSSEIRARVFAERRDDIGEHVRVALSAYVDGLLDRRGESDARTAIVRPGDLYVELFSEALEIRVGVSRVVWGRLDEFQPTDVINPIDLSRFLLEGRSEARLPVALARVRVFLPGSSTLEGVAVPAFRSSRFDQLDEQTSPFNISPVSSVAVERREPFVAWKNLQGGARLTTTAARIDWAVSAYRGFRTFPIFTAQPAGVIESFPRFTMVGGDFETVRGAWGVRGELAAFVSDTLQSTRAATGVPGHLLEGGAGVDRRAGDYRVAANVLWSRRRVDSSTPLGAALAGDPELHDSDFSIVGAADRSFARETRTLRMFVVYDPLDDTAFVRGIAAVSVREDVWIEGSAGVFAGASADTFGRLRDRDFIYARLKVFF